MKKYVVSALLASMVLSAGSVYATPVGQVELDGTFQYIYRWEHNTNTPPGWVNGSTNIEKFVLNAKTGVTENLDAYARFGAEYGSTPWLGIDFYDDTPNGKHSAASIDQMGFIYQNSGWTYKVGRQDSYIGGLSGLYSSIYFVGPKSSVDGIHITGKSGVTDIDFQAFQEHYSYLDDGNRVYSLRGSYSPSQAWTLGATIAKYDDRNNRHVGGSTSTKNWGVDANYTTGKASLYGEYTQSDANTENKSWAVGASYAPDDKNTFNVIHYDGGINGDVGGWDVANAPYQPGGGGFEPSFKGMYYILDHKMDKSTTATVFWRNMKSRTPNADGTFHSNDNLRVIVTYAF
jgi:hypothetical protein